MLASQQKRCSDCRAVLYWIIERSQFYCHDCRAYTSVKYVAGVKYINELYPGNPRVYNIEAVDRLLRQEPRHHHTGIYEDNFHRHHYPHKVDNLVLTERPREKGNK